MTMDEQLTGDGTFLTADHSVRVFAVCPPGETRRLERPVVPTGDTPGIDLNNPAYFTNRELSQLEFNRRVLELASDPSTPLLERLRFIVICSTNLDEFFEIRVSGLHQAAQYGMATSEPDGLSPKEALQRISEVAHGLMDEQYRILREEVMPALRDEGIFLLRREEWDPAMRSWLRDYFEEQVVPVLTPIAIDPSHPFPRILNKALNFAVELEGEDAYGRQGRVAVVQVPRSLPRLIRLPVDITPGRAYTFVRVSSVVREFMGELFSGMEVKGAYQFRLTRNSDLWVDEEEVDDLLSAIRGELSNRSFGEAVRLVASHKCTDEMAEFLLDQFGLGPADFYRVNGPVNPHRLMGIYEMVDRPDLKYPAFTPASFPESSKEFDIFARIREGDVLLHHPFQSFLPVVEMARAAASDPNVLSIKMTLYRTGSSSPFVEALAAAARAGKDVTAVIELRARFDEAANIDLATRLQDVGVNVAYGIVGYKCHAKLMQVVRREGQRLRRYVHLGTGNYHAGTARAYTDISLMTCRPDISLDVHKLFLQLTGLGGEVALHTLIHAPFTLEKSLLSLIEAEAEAARQGKPSGIRARMNAITERRIIQALYRASQAGVPVDLLVRGVCCLRPGIPGVSHNIRVKSVLGRFLEHSRVFNFVAGGQNLTYASSADWMTRNLVRRVEACFPVGDPGLKSRVVDETLDRYFADNGTAWMLQPDGSYARVERGDAPLVSAQGQLLAHYCGLPG
jgi:polyphosphate kinase